MKGPKKLTVPNLLTDLAGFGIRSLALVGVLYLLSRLPRLRLTLESRKGFLFLLLWGGLGLLAPSLTRCSAYVPCFAGRLGGSPAGLLVGLFTALPLAGTGHSTPTLVLQLVAGWLGGKLGWAGPRGLALAAGALSLLAMDMPEHPGIWLPGRLLDGGRAGLVELAYLWLGFTLGSALFGAALAFLIQQPDRERARAADRVFALVEQIDGLLSEGLTASAAEELAPRLRLALEVPALYLERDDRLLGFAGSCPHLHSRRECPADCPYTDWLAVDLAEGARLLVLRTQRESFPAGVETLARGVGAVLSTRLQKQALEHARFAFLQAQIQPHFLFNTLNSLAALCTREPERCRQLVLQLAEFLRRSLSRGPEQIPLQDELEVVRLYLSIEQVRFGARLRVHWQLPDPLPDCRVPAFCLQPLAENAVRHGLSPQVEGGNLWLRVRAEGEIVHIEIEDDGVGMDQETPVPGSGIGLHNVRQRLKGQLWVSAGSSSGTKVVIEVPLAHPAR